MLSTGLVEQKDVPVGGITLLADGTAKIDVASAFSEAPVTGSVFLFQNDEVQSQQFRVVSVAEADDGLTELMLLHITARSMTQLKLMLS